MIPVPLIQYEMLVSLWGEQLTSMFYHPIRRF